MESKIVRQWLRWFHLMLGLVLMCYVYSPFHQWVWFQWTVKIGVIPFITLSGLWLWKPALFNRWLLQK